MSFLDALMTPAKIDAEPFAERVKRLAKPMPAALAKIERDKSKKVTDDAFRARIWALDKGLCRATGKPLVKSNTTDWEKLGEVDHSIPRSLAPDRIYDTSNALLLQKKLNRLRKVACIHAPEYRVFDYEGPDNRRLPQRFLWRDADGKIVKETRG